MGASAYIGRVGGLAVALGVGVAVATGQGVASADTESNSSTSESSASTGASSGSTNKSPDSRKPSASTRRASETRKPSESRKRAESRRSSAAGSENSPDTTDTTDIDARDPEDSGNTEATEPSTDQRENAAGSEDSPAPEPAPKPRHSTTSKRANPPSSRAPRPDRLTDTNAAVTTARVTARTVDTAATSAPAPAAQTGGAQPAVTAVSLPETTAQSLTAATTVSAESVPPRRGVVQRALVSLFSSLGIGPSASDLPDGPVRSPFAMALLALGARREYMQQIRTLAKTLTTQPVAALTMSELAAAATTTYPGTARPPETISTNTSFIEFVTGQYGSGRGQYNLNYTISRFGIGGTDLGIMWDNGIEDDPTTAVNEHQVLIAFGDTFSSNNPVRTGVWRFNTLFRTDDNVLGNGLYVPNGIPFDDFSGSPMERPNWSDPILPSPGQPVHPPYAIGNEVTIIPTAGVSVKYDNAYGSRQYMSFMSVRSWDTPGRWTTNYSGVAYSDDNGQTWRIAPTSIRTAAVGRATVPFVSGNQNFQQGAFVKPPAGSPEADQGWVYSYGTPSGRAGALYLSRVQQDQILDVTKYQYWNGTGWTTNTPSAATPVLPGTTRTTVFGTVVTLKKPPTVSELSVQYNPYLDRYVMLYGDSGNNIVMRTATSPEGKWSEPTRLVSSFRVPGLYAPFIHPWSGTENVSEAEQQYLYWNLSTWGDYQVRFMRTDLAKIKV